MNQPMSPLRGIVPPVITPLTDTGQLDIESLEKHVDFLIENGVHGLFVLGTSGEFPYLTDTQRLQVVTTTVRAARGRVPVVAGAMETSSRRAIELAKAVEHQGADGIVVSAPFYAVLSDFEIMQHFDRVAKATEVPLIAYNIPSRTYSTLTPALVKHLVDEKLIISLKDSGSEMGDLRRCAALSSDSFTVLTGSEQVLDAAMLIGAAGGVPGMANVDPAGFARVYEAAMAGEWATAQIEQDRLFGLFDIITVGRSRENGFDSAAYGGFKYALVKRGVIATAYTGNPEASLSQDAKQQIDKWLDDSGLLTVQPR